MPSRCTIVYYDTFLKAGVILSIAPTMPIGGLQTCLLHIWNSFVLLLLLLACQAFFLVCVRSALPASSLDWLALDLLPHVSQEPLSGNMDEL